MAIPVIPLVPGAASTGDTVLQSAAAANGNGNQLSVVGDAVVEFTVNMVGFTGTLTFQGSEDTINFDPLNATQLGTGNITNNIVGATTTSVHVYEASVSGLQRVQAVVSGYSAGTVTVTANATALTRSTNQANIAQLNGAAPGPLNPMYVHQAIGTPVTASATGAAAATAVATLPGVANKTTYITGFTATSGNPGATVVGVVTVVGTISGTMSYQFTESATLGGELIVVFPTPIPASALNTAIVVTIPAITSGAVVAIAAYGYQL